MNLTRLKKSIQSIIDHMLYVEQIPPQEVELALRIEVDEVIDTILQEYELDTISNIRLEDLEEDEFPSDISTLETLILQEKTFDEVWDVLMSIIKNKNKD